MFFERMMAENKLKEYIERHKGGNSKIPSERFLSEHFGMPRSQIRKILSSLVIEGDLFVKKNSGYYISPEKISIDLNKGESYYDTTTEKVQRTKLITKSEITFSKELKNIIDLNVNSGIKLLGIQTLNHIPYGVITSYFPATIDNQLNIEDYYCGNLFELFKRTGSPIAHVREEITKSTSSSFEEEILNIAPDSPLAKHKTFGYNEQGQCILYQLILYPITCVTFKGWLL